MSGFTYADTLGKRIGGNLVYYFDEHANNRRLVDGIGPNVVKYLTDFVDLPVNASGEYNLPFTVTKVGASTFGPTDGSGGLGLITTGAVENDGINAQVPGEAFKLALNGTTWACYFGCRLKISEATQSDFFLGLAITDTDILGGVTDRVGFEKLDGSTAVKAMVEKNSTETLSGTLLTADTNFHTYELFFNGTTERGGPTLDFFIDGAEVAVNFALTNLPDDEELTPSLQFLAGSAGAKTATFDWIRAIQVGERAS